MFLRASKSKGQGAVEYLLILAVVLVIALAAITYVSSASSESARTNKMESQVYWGSVATPLKIQDAGAAYGTICQQPEKGGYQFLLRNSEPYDISLSSISIDGVQRVFCVAGSPSGALQISARSQRFVAAITASGELPCKEGDLVYLNLGFGFNKSGVSGLSQEGSKPLVLICANSAPINETSIIGVHTGARANITISAAPSLSSAYVGEAIPSVQVSAQGGTSPYAWSVAGLPSGLSFSNGAIIGAPALGTEGVHNILIQASDYVGNTGELEIQMTVYSLPTITSGRLPNANVGSPYSFEIITAGGQTPYSWYTTGLPSGLSQLGSTISGAPAQGTAGTYSVFMRLTDFSGHSANATLPLHVNLAYPVMITTNSLSYAYEQQDYFFQLSAQGGTSPYSWEITAGSLPAGLSLMPSTGAIIGIPNAGTEGNYTFTVRATDSVGTTNSKSFTMYVILSSLTIRTASLSDGTIGSPYSATLSATGGVPPYTWAQSGAPSDMGFDSNGRLHSSEQYVLGISVGDYLTYHAVIYPKTYAVTFTVTDSNHTSTSKSLNLKVNIVIASPTLNTTLPYGFENQAYSTPLRAYGGIPPYSWSECYSYFAGIC
ncbi:MAG: putative Ig domain-containing protein, partial [Candidatus Micrarchaeota archaeon]|nr:putative Ig domain-containing protein [Candidatus Micrarchaeota archaeon]